MRLLPEIRAQILKRLSEPSPTMDRFADELGLTETDLSSGIVPVCDRIGTQIGTATLWYDPETLALSVQVHLRSLPVLGPGDSMEIRIADLGHDVVLIRALRVGLER